MRLRTGYRLQNTCGMFLTYVTDVCKATEQNERQLRAIEVAYLREGLNVADICDRYRTGITINNIRLMQKWRGRMAEGGYRRLWIGFTRKNRRLRITRKDEVRDAVKEKRIADWWK